MATAFNYVKFVRGTPSAFNNLAEKNSDTLYFISNSDDSKGSLYLGSKLISKDVSGIADLNDILISESLADKHILSYDEQNSKWVNKAIVDAIGLMIGATATSQGGNGLVPAPGIGQQTMFLRGDGTWGMPQETVDFNADDKSLTILDENNVISLKDFGVKYYKHVAETETVPAHYEPQEVDSAHPWKAYLEPKVVEENGELILGWFEPDPITNEIPKLKTRVQSIDDTVTELKSLVDTKANSSAVYSKEETQTLITTEIAKTNHLIRKTFNSIDEAELFILLEDHPENYIYMILSSDILEDNKYDEYLYVDGHLEKVGSWQTDLSDYVTKQEFNSHVTNVTDLLNNKVDKSEVQAIDTKVTNLETLLNNKADKTEISAIDTKITNLSDLVGGLNTKVSNLETFMNSDYFIKKEDYEADINTVKEAVTWRDL